MVPLADSRLTKPVAFTALVDGPAVTTGEEEVWSDAAGEEDDGPLTAEKKAEATQRFQEAGPIWFRPSALHRTDVESRTVALRRARTSRSLRIGASRSCRG